MQQTVKIHSKLGIASVVGGSGMFCVYLLALAVYYFEQGLGHSLGQSESASDIRLLDIFMMLLVPIPAHIVCLIPGIVALFFPNRRKLFPIIGVVLNLIFGVLALFPWLYLVFASMGRVQ